MNIAEKYNIDSDKLQARMKLIKIQYQRDVAEYEKTGDYEDQYDTINAAASKLITALERAHSSTLYQVGVVNDPFIDRLTILKNRAGNTEVSMKGRKQKFHRNLLILQLRKAWMDLTGKAPNLSTNTGSFKDFMEDVTKHLGIDSKGLWSKYRNKLHARFSR